MFFKAVSISADIYKGRMTLAGQVMQDNQSIYFNPPLAACQWFEADSIP